jgi:Uma2 family endonuclease
MGIAAPIHRLSPADYPAWEAVQPDRNELFDGVPYALAGPGRLHEEVAVALASLLWAHLRGGPWRVYKSHRQLQVGSDFFYPDVVVTGDFVDLRTDGALRAPAVIIEVLTRPTAAFDRGEKRERYATLPSLQSYLVVDPETRVIERYDRANGWVGDALPADEPLVIAPLRFSIAQAEVFSTLD